MEKIKLKRKSQKQMLQETMLKVAALEVRVEKIERRMGEKKHDE